MNLAFFGRGLVTDAYLRIPISFQLTLILPPPFRRFLLGVQRWSF
jgi:hypothetical protein